MTITDLIKEGEEFRDSIGDSAHDIGKIQDSSKYHLWIERVVRFLGQNVPKDISIERFMLFSNQINPIHCIYPSQSQVKAPVVSSRQTPVHTGSPTARTPHIQPFLSTVLQSRPDSLSDR